jgi:SAM-dependent methyltransferase
MTNPNNSTVIRSPITGGTDVVIVRKVDCRNLIAEYKRILNLDISYLTRGHQELSLYKCDESGYRFYHPSDVVGDSEFYHRLESYEWYYMSSKWEFEESLKFIKAKSAVLEIGSGSGAFLRAVMQRIPHAVCTGIEVNQHAADLARSHGINVVLETPSEHIKRHTSSYDVIACFQLLEHIPNPMQFLREGLVLLKHGGLLIIGVPDNSARSAQSIFLTTDNILNMPPHHQGLWDIPSLSFLAKVLPIRLEYMAIEPATAMHRSNSYRGIMKRDLMHRFGKYFGFMIYLVGRPYYNHALKHLNQYLPAHSVLAVFRKNG